MEVVRLSPTEGLGAKGNMWRVSAAVRYRAQLLNAEATRHCQYPMVTTDEFLAGSIPRNVDTASGSYFGDDSFGLNIQFSEQ